MEALAELVEMVERGDKQSMKNVLQQFSLCKQRQADITWKQIEIKIRDQIWIHIRNNIWSNILVKDQVVETIIETNIAKN